MNPRPTPNPYKRHRFPAEIISHCVWLYLSFCLSYRDVEELMAERGVLLEFPEALWCYVAKPIDQGRLHDILAQLFPPSLRWGAHASPALSLASRLDDPGASRAAETPPSARGSLLEAGPQKHGPDIL
jgi:hypothetical protein